MDRFQVSEFVIVCVYADAEIETCVATVDNLVIAELNKVGLRFLVSRSYNTVDFLFYSDLLVIVVGNILLG